MRSGTEGGFGDFSSTDANVDYVRSKTSLMVRRTSDRIEGGRDIRPPAISRGQFRPSCGLKDEGFGTELCTLKLGNANNADDGRVT